MVNHYVQLPRPIVQVIDGLSFTDTKRIRKAFAKKFCYCCRSLIASNASVLKDRSLARCSYHFFLSLPQDSLKYFARPSRSSGHNSSSVCKIRQKVSVGRIHSAVHDRSLSPSHRHPHRGAHTKRKIKHDKDLKQTNPTDLRPTEL